MTDAATLGTASTIPPPDLECRCREVRDWATWIRASLWIDATGRLIESRTCPDCACSRSIVKVSP